MKCTNYTVFVCVVLSYILLPKLALSQRSISYSPAVEIGSATLNPANVFSVPTGTRDLSFSNDGMKLFVVVRSALSADLISEYSLSLPFDVSTATTAADFDLDVSGVDTDPIGLTFNRDGTRMYFLGQTNDMVYEYQLSVPFTLSSAVQSANVLDISTEDTGATDIEMSRNGEQLFLVGGANNTVFQYDLSIANDLSSAVYSNLSVPLGAGENGPTGISFNSNGTRMFISGTTNRRIQSYELSNGYDFSISPTFNGRSLDVEDTDNSPRGVFINEDGSIAFLLGDQNDQIYGFDLSANAFQETAANSGTVDGEIIFRLTGETFISGTLDFGVNYTIPNLPTGLTPSAVINNDLQTAVLTISGAATLHDDVNDINDLQINFLDGAFTGGLASSVTGNGSSGLRIDFSTDIPVELVYANPITISTAVQEPANIFAVPTLSRGITFNDDGSKMYVLNTSGVSDDMITEYVLSLNFDVSTAVQNHQVSVSFEDTNPTDLTFNNSGTRLYLLGQENDAVYEYTLDIPFDLSTSFFNGNTFVVSTEETSPSGLTFSPDGERLFVVGNSGGRNVNQYNLATAFDISTATFSNNFFPIGNGENGPTSLVFNANGSQLLVVGTSLRRILSFDLSSNFDLSTAPIFSGITLDVSNEDTSPQDLFIDKTGNHLFLLGDQNDQVYGYDISNDVFIETGTNDGSVNGSLILSLKGGETFANAGGTLTETTDYSLDSRLLGLVPNISVAPNGMTALLTLSGVADNHNDLEDIQDMAITFNNSSFVEGTVSTIANSAVSTLGVDFVENIETEILYATPIEVSTGNPNLANVFASPTIPRDVIFNRDGNKMYILNNSGTGPDLLTAYELSVPFDVSTASQSATLDLSFEDTNPTGVAFNLTGNRLYVIGLASDRIHEYFLPDAFDISTASYTGNTLDVSLQETNPSALVISQDGNRLFVLGSSGNREVYQYDLSIPFDLNSATFSNNSFPIGNGENGPTGLAFSLNGRRMFVVGTSNDRIYSYDLSESYDLSIAPVFTGVTLDISAEDTSPHGIFLDETGTHLFLIGDQNDQVFGYDISQNAFVETGINDGSLTGSLIMRVTGDLFANAGGMLTEGTDYTFDSRLNGIIPSISIANDGQTAVLTTSGNAMAHNNVDDIGSIDILFNNSAFINTGTAPLVATNSNLSVDFAEDIPVDLIYSTPIEISTGLANVANSFASPTVPRDISFSRDGSRMFILNNSGTVADLITAYNLNTPFDASTAVQEATLDVSFEDTSPTGLTFNLSGTRLYVVGLSSDNVHEYLLAVPFDITTASYTGNTLDVSGQETSPSALAISEDGTRLFVVGSSGTRQVFQYDLATPFDLNTGVFSNNSFPIGNGENSPSGLAFSLNGSRMFVVGTSLGRILSFDLINNYDLAISPVFTGVTLDVSNEDTAPQGMYIDESGTRLFLMGDANDQVIGYDLSDNAFTEAGANDGAVRGSMIMRITGDTFSNQGATLTETTDYTFDSQLTDLIPLVTVADDGQTAVLSLSGSAINHDDANDLASIDLTFEASAFNNPSSATIINPMPNPTGVDFAADLSPNIGYTSAIEVSTGRVNAFNTFTVSTSPRSVSFNTDGTKMFVLNISGTGSDFVNEYNLTTAFDVSTSTLTNQLVVSFEESNPSAFTFNVSGTRLYVVGNTSNAIHEYLLEQAFDLSTASFTGNTLVVTTEETAPTGLAISPDGLRLFVIGSSGTRNVNQYNLSIPFDITSGFFSGNSFPIGNDENSPTEVLFNADGSRMFVLGTSIRRVLAYHLADAFDLTIAPVFSGVSLDVSIEDTSPQGMFLDPFGTRLYVVGDENDAIFTYDLSNNAFLESGANDGSVEGELILRLTEERFINVDAVLTEGTDYNVTNLPTGLSPELVTSIDGLTAFLTLSGAADLHDDANDIEDIQISFEDVAFIGGNALEVNNAVNGNTGLRIDFTTDLARTLTYTPQIFLSAGRINNTNLFAGPTNPREVTFNTDGSKMYLLNISGTGSDLISEYSLSINYDISTATLSAQFPTSFEDSNPTGFTFNSSGTRLFVVGSGNDAVYEYHLSTPFDITTSAYTGVSFSVVAEETSPSALTFSNDGTKLFVIGSSGTRSIYQYQLLNPYQLEGAVFSGTSFPIGNGENSPTGLTFNKSGTQLFVVGTSLRRVLNYDLNNPFDLTIPPVFSNLTLDISNEDTSPQGIFLTSEGTRLFMIGDENDQVRSYDLSQDSFNETVSNNGQVQGNMIISLDGDTFNNLGTQLINGTDYAILNLPVGFLPNLTVSTQGDFATLELTGTAIDHDESNDVEDLQFTFQNSAFLGADASLIDRSMNASSNLRLDFTQDLGPNLLFATTAEITSSVLSDSLDVSASLTTPSGLTFSNDGMRLYLLNRSTRSISEYLMTTPYDISNATLNLTLDVSFEENSPSGLTFNASGTSLYLLGTANDAIAIYDLATPFELTSASFSGNTFDVSSEMTSPNDLHFSSDGFNLFVIGGATDLVFRYVMTVPFDLSTATFTIGDSFSVATEETSAAAISFNANGTNMYVAGTSGAGLVFEYDLSVGYDLSTAVFNGNQLQTINQDDLIESMYLDHTGTRFFFFGSATNRVISYDLTTNAFAENPSNDGSVLGSMVIRVVDDLFTNESGNLTLDTDFTMGNIPDDLIPNLAINSNGLIATLTLTGNTIKHDDINDVNDIQISFANSAFFGNDASLIPNADLGSSNLVIDFFGPTAPSDLRTIEISDSQIDLTWTDNSTDESGFAIFRSIGDTSSFVEIAEIAEGSVGYNDTGVMPGNNYYYQVVSRNGEGDSSPSEIRAASTLESPGNALDFDGIDDFVSVPSLDFPIGDFTLEAWVNYNGAGGFETIIEFGDDDPFFGLSNGNPTLFNGIVTSPNPIFTGVWTHVGVSYNAATNDVVLYVNGQVVDQANQVLSFTGEGMGIGQNAGDTPFTGEIDEVRIWEELRTEGEIQSTLLTELIGNETGLLAYYQFDQSVSGFTTLPDRSGNQHDGILTNFDFNGFGNGSDWTTSEALQITVPTPTALEATMVEPLAFTANWDAITTISNYTLDVSRDDAFTDLVTGFDNIVIPATSALITGLDYRTDYHYRIRGIIAPGDTTDFSNTVAVTTTISTGTLADSTALVNLYNALGGPNWDIQNNWLVPNTRIETWSGITLLDGRVSEIVLDANNLTGNFPVLNGEELDQLNIIDLSSNDITSLPDLSRLTQLTTFNMSGNRLSFESIEPNVGISGAVFSPQNILLDAISVFSNEGEDVILDRVIGGSVNNYVWQKDGVTIPGGEDGTLELTAVIFEDDGIYTVEVTNSNASGIILSANPINLRVSSLERDSLALRAVYDAMGGDMWQGRDNWRPENNMPISAWEGVTVSQNRVTMVDISGSNVTGTLPTDILDVLSLENLNLSNNLVDSIPDLSVLVSLSTLNVSDNLLQFDDLEANLGITNFNFTNQQLEDSPFSMEVKAESNFTVSVEVKGENNEYQWSLNGSEITGATSATYLIESVNRSNEGDYTCEINNTLVSGLTFTSEIRAIIGVADISGFARIAGTDNQFLEAGSVLLLAIRENAYDTIMPIQTLSTGGAYLFENVRLQDYIVLADPQDRETFLPTYHEQVIQWDFADTLKVNADTTNIDINVEPVPPVDNLGDGSLVGDVFTDFPDDGRLEARRRVRRVGCALRRRRGQGRPGQGRGDAGGRVEMDDDGFELFSYQTTNDEGQFTFESLPVGTYRIFIEYPGIPLDPNSFTEFEVGDNPNEDDFAVEVTVFEDGILIEERDVVSVLEDFFEEFNIYPNPANDEIFVNIKALENYQIEIELLDLTGASVLSQQMETLSLNSETNRIDLTGISSGLYLIRLKIPDSQTQSFKIGKLVID